MAQRHILVIANQTVAGHALIDAVRSKAGEGDVLVYDGAAPAGTGLTVGRV